MSARIPAVSAAGTLPGPCQLSSSPKFWRLEETIQFPLARSLGVCPDEGAQVLAEHRQMTELVTRMGQVAQTRFGQEGPGERYAHWTRRFVLFHDKRHPRDLHPGDVRRFLEHVAQTEKDPLNCLEEAHIALTFLYQDVLGLDVGELPFRAPPRLLDRLRRACRVRQFSPRTENGYAGWAERFIAVRPGLRPRSSRQTRPWTTA